MTARVFVSAMLLAAATALPACQRVSGGPLDPVEGDDVTIESGRAVLTEGRLEARVTGRWSTTGPNSMRIAYRNAGSGPVRVTIAGLKMEHELGEAALRTAIDATGVDMTDAREDNNQGKPLFSLDGGGGAGVLDVPAGAMREVDADLTPFANAGGVEQGDRLVLTVPLATRSVAVTFTAARPSGLP